MGPNVLNLPEMTFKVTPLSRLAGCGTGLHNELCGARVLSDADSARVAAITR